MIAFERFPSIFTDDPLNDMVHSEKQGTPIVFKIGLLIIAIVALGHFYKKHIGDQYERLG